jgi:hypothetical protein
MLISEPPAPYADPPAAYTVTEDRRDYPACLAAVKAGKSVTLAVGVTDRADYATPSLTGISPGVYDCWLDGAGVPKMKRREAAQPLLPRLFNPPLVPALGRP